MKERDNLAGAVVDSQLGRHRRAITIDMAVQRQSTRRSARLRECGQAMVEIAFVLPLFLLFVFAIIEIGRAWGAKQALTNAAREGARILILPYGAGYTYESESDAQTAAINAVKDSMNGSGVPAGPATITLVRITPGDDGVFNTGDDQIEENYSGGQRGDRVGVQIKYPFETFAPILLKMFETGGGGSAQRVVNMGMTCYMDHE